MWHPVGLPPARRSSGDRSLGIRILSVYTSVRGEDMRCIRGESRRCERLVLACGFFAFRASRSRSRLVLFATDKHEWAGLRGAHAGSRLHFPRALLIVHAAGDVVMTQRSPLCALERTSGTLPLAPPIPARRRQGNWRARVGIGQGSAPLREDSRLPALLQDRDK